MKTMLELPESLLKEAEAVAVSTGLPLDEFVAGAIRSRLAAASGAPSKPWMKHFGSLRHLHSESERILRIVGGEFGDIDEKAWE